jgi:GntR family transcriptional repressor for pyruvate dehydrogenase complex
MLRSTRLYEQLVERIELKVLSGELRPGDRLPSERELAEKFGISRTAVREAVKALQEKGLVDIQIGRGTFIKHGTSQAVRHSLGFMVRIGQADGQADLVQVRSILEPEIAALAADGASQDDIGRMEHAIEAMDHALDDAEAFVEADLEFHLALAIASRNSLIPILIDPIVDLLREHRKRIFLVSGGPQRGQVYHKRILEAIKRHDVAQAREAMRAHLEQVRADSDLAGEA